MPMLLKRLTLLKPMPMEGIIAEPRRCSGFQFDPDVVEMLIKVIKDENILNASALLKG